MWPQLIIAIVAAVVAVAVTSKPVTANQAASEDVNVPKLPLGSPYGILQGTVEINGAGHAWHGDVSAKAIKSKGGKK